MLKRKRISNSQLTPNPYATGKITISKREPIHDHEKEVERLNAKLEREREQREAIRRA